MGVALCIGFSVVGAAWYNEVPLMDLDVLLTRSQGNLHHGIIDHRRRSQSPPDTDQEPHLHYLLRGRRNLRRHHVHRLLLQAQPRHR